MGFWYDVGRVVFSGELLLLASLWSQQEVEHEGNIGQLCNSVLKLIMFLSNLLLPRHWVHNNWHIRYDTLHNMWKQELTSMCGEVKRSKSSWASECSLFSKSYATEWERVRALLQTGVVEECVAALTSWWTCREWCGGSWQWDKSSKRRDVQCTWMREWNSLLLMRCCRNFKSSSRPFSWGESFCNECRRCWIPREQAKLLKSAGDMSQPRPLS